MFRRADPRDVNSCGGDAGIRDLIDSGRPSIEFPMPRARLTREPSVDSRRIERGLEPRTNLAIDFVTGGTDGGPDGNDQVTRVRAELLVHRADRGLRRSGRQPPPARMRGTDCACDTVSDQKRDAIRRLDGNSHSGVVGEDDVGGGPGVLERRTRAPDHDRSAMDLVQAK
jgi:hypothetical protein